MSLRRLAVEYLTRIADTLLQEKLSHSGAVCIRGSKWCGKLAVSDKIDQGVMGAPSFSAVVTPGGYAYRRSDGILVLPISRLRPWADLCLARPMAWLGPRTRRLTRGRRLRGCAGSQTVFSLQPVRLANLAQDD